MSLDPCQFTWFTGMSVEFGLYLWGSGYLATKKIGGIIWSASMYTQCIKFSWKDMNSHQGEEWVSRVIVFFYGLHSEWKGKLLADIF